MTCYQLHNKDYDIVVDPRGAELLALIYRGENFLWSGDPRWWAKTSPLLFPIVGRLPQAEYTWRRKKYQMAKHGFAREQRFSLVCASQQALTFELNGGAQIDANIFKHYPFEFSLQVTYSLHLDRLQVAWKVINRGESDMPFSIGAHPAFVFPCGAGMVAINDMQLCLPRPFSITRMYINERGLRTGKTQKMLDQGTELQFHSAQFREDCLQFRCAGLEQVTLKNSRTDHRISMHFEGFTHFGIWTPYRDGETAPFVCLEPWFGNDSATDDDGSFENKEGMIMLPPASTFSAGYSISIDNLSINSVATASN